MTRKEQDKLWAELSEDNKKIIRRRYNSALVDIDNNEDVSKNRGIVQSLKEIFGEHNLKPQLTYGDVIKELFKNGAWQVVGREYPREFVFNEDANDHYFLNCTSEEQGQKLLAINKLLNVAKFLNKNEDGSVWIPDWKNANERKYYITIHCEEIEYSSVSVINSGQVYFRSEVLAKKAVEILGENVIRTALTTVY